MFQLRLVWRCLKLTGSASSRIQAAAGVSFSALSEWVLSSNFCPQYWHRPEPDLRLM